MDRKEYHYQWRLKNKDKINNYAEKYRNKYRNYLRFYWVYNAMKKRCDDKNFKQYKDYGGRGVTYCEEWKNYQNFKKEMYPSYKSGLTLDRIDVNGIYCKENCKWSTHKEQNNNKRCNIILTYCGETKTLLDWSSEMKISFNTLRSRYYRGMDTYKILTNDLYRPAKL